MRDYKESKWAKRIIETQKADGSFGYFHTLSEPKKFPLTTEQALRRLEILGYTIEDQVIKKAVNYMEKCLTRELDIPDYKEKHDHWEIFVDLMLATWINRFTDKSENANRVKEKWARITTKTFMSGKYSLDDFSKAYFEEFGIYNKKTIIYVMSRFYNVSLMCNTLDEKTEELFFDYVLNNENGVYYVYSSKLSIPPQDFRKKDTSRYLAGIEMLSKYHRNKHKLSFVVDWLNKNRLDESSWDMGSSIKDGIYMPLSDDWRKTVNRVTDCTYRIKRLIKEIEE